MLHLCMLVLGLLPVPAQVLLQEPDDAVEKDKDKPSCSQNDEWEFNDAPEEAANLPLFLDAIVAGTSIDAYLCAGEDDWYLIKSSLLPFEVQRMIVHGILEGSSLCGEVCGFPSLKPGPKHTLVIEIYDAKLLELINYAESDEGRISMDGGDAQAFQNDIMIRVYSPTAKAKYEYALEVSLQSYGGEDECEC